MSPYDKAFINPNSETRPRLLVSNDFANPSRASHANEWDRQRRTHSKLSAERERTFSESFGLQGATRPALQAGATRLPAASDQLFP